MKNQLFFAFDLDGVLVDTIGTLYIAYLNILNRLGATGSADEFDFLNGKNLHEIAAHLKHTHQLDCDEAELRSLFQDRFDLLYSEVDLIPGAVDVLEFLKAADARIALSSSSSRKNIDIIFKRFELEQFFEVIVSGDLVVNAKPAPDIYNLVKSHFNTNRVFVVEDSLNGIQAARCAGLFTILFNPDHQVFDFRPSFTVTELSEIRQIVNRRHEDPVFVSTCVNIEIAQQAEGLSLPKDLETRANEIWQAAQRESSSLFNGQILCYASHHVMPDNSLMIDGFVSEHKYAFAQLNDETVHVISPLAVSGVVVDKKGRYLIGQRSKNVSEYPGFYEFVPSGGINADDGIVNDYEKQLITELEEETGIRSELIDKTSLIGLIFDAAHKVYDIAVLLELGMEIELNDLNSSEYSAFSLVDGVSLELLVNNEDFVPTSRMLFAELRSTGRQRSASN